MSFTYRLILEDGTPADPPSFSTAVPSWHPGDTVRSVLSDGCELAMLLVGMKQAARATGSAPRASGAHQPRARGCLGSSTAAADRP